MAITRVGCHSYWLWHVEKTDLGEGKDPVFNWTHSARTQNMEEEAFVMGFCGLDSKNWNNERRDKVM